MKIKKTICLILIISIIISYTCNKEREILCNCFPRNRIYKSNRDYSKYVAVAMTDDKKGINGHPAATDLGGDSTCQIITLTDNYYFPNGCIYGINTGFLTITRVEFQKLYWELKADEYMNYILDADPFLEYYEELPCDSCLRDTASINNAIRNNELEKYYKRLK